MQANEEGGGRVSTLPPYSVTIVVPVVGLMDTLAGEPGGVIRMSQAHQYQRDRDMPVLGTLKGL